MGRQDYETETVIAVAHALRGEGFDASEDGTGRGTPLVPIAFSAMPMNSGKDFVVRETDIAQPIMAAGPALGNQGGDYVVQPVAFDTTQLTSKANRSQPKAGDPSHPLAAGAHAPAIAYGLRRDADRSGEAKTPSMDAHGNLRIRDAGFNAYEELSPTLDTVGPHTVATNWAVRRLTPRECERLQGFPDGYTDVPWRNKNWTPDGPRYKALGNSMAVNVMRWLGRRIELVSTLALSSQDRGNNG
jgi:DNA (cytosine-5)-methyltransferase 1